MRRKWLLAGAVSIIVAIAFAACGGGGDGDGDDGDDGGGDGGTPAPGTLLTARLQSVGGSLVTGSVDLVQAEEGDGVQVDVSVTGLAEGRHASRLQAGNCEEPGEVVAELEELGAGPERDLPTEAVTVVEGAELSDFEPGHILAVYEGGEGSEGAVVACGILEEGS